MGLLGSLHCVGMCGPLVMAMPFSGPHGGQPASRIFSYHAGRLLTYASLGVAVGLLGSGLRFFFVQQWISIGSGVLLLLIYFLPKLLGSERFPAVSAAWNRHVVVRMRKLLAPGPGGPAHSRMFTLGLLNGLLPCGLVYMALIGAVSQPTVWQSALFMAIFGVGTSPALTGVIFANKLVLPKVKTLFARAIPYFVVVVSALLILRGLGLGIPYLSPADERNCCHRPEASVLCAPANSTYTTIEHDELSHPAAFQAPYGEILHRH